MPPGSGVTIGAIAEHAESICGASNNYTDATKVTSAFFEAYGYEEGFVMPALSFRFAAETGCNARTTQEVRVDQRTRVVEGCGRRMTYINVCSPIRSWIANVESELK